MSIVCVVIVVYEDGRDTLTRSCFRHGLLGVEVPSFRDRVDEVVADLVVVV